MDNPNLQDFTESYHKQLQGMTVKEVRLQALKYARKHLLETIIQQLSSTQQQFIFSIKLT
ncbi:hypothetical protein JYU12_00390 [bacterium AH-315-K03]|nr:hypothetical protein [bacterium AH-315-K03]